MEELVLKKAGIVKTGPESEPMFEQDDFDSDTIKKKRKKDKTTKRMFVKSIEHKRKSKLKIETQHQFEIERESEGVLNYFSNWDPVEDKKQENQVDFFFGDLPFRENSDDHIFNFPLSKKREQIYPEELEQEDNFKDMDKKDLDKIENLLLKFTQKYILKESNNS